jgi:hypothetical protein
VLGDRSQQLLHEAAGDGAVENRDVAIVDIPGAFMEADMEEQEDGRDDIGDRRSGEMVLYVEPFMALYGTLRAARWFWEKLSQQLNEWRFIANPYDV